ncbi:glycoside hydrolase superfamily [Crepidotus variabilis]|uniref:beta-glucosidase n=1 Tax=Crepidotus variabilis TaxID=179855 RepID=A0A9P6JQP8_9AGAR|nr:glycoside hydrolase superfamily [Crepidotus variabilis]
MRLTVWQLVPLLPFVIAQDASSSSLPVSSIPTGSATSVLGSAVSGSSALSTASSTASATGSLSASSAASSSATTNTSTSSVSSSSAAPSPTGSTIVWTPLPNTPQTFTPFPVPSDVPQSGYPPTDPSDPPQVGSTNIPDFGPAWRAAWQKAKAKVSKWTLEEKVNSTTGIGWANGRCVGNIAAIEPRDGRGWPGLCLEDSPLGIRFADFVTAFPAAINAAASFNRDLIRQRGVLMGKEHVAKGVNVALGPMMNLGRVAAGGRNWEGFGADPWWSGEGAYETILGMQSTGVTACAKHLVGNEQEYKRTQSSSEIDDRTLHELYAHPFLRSVMAGVGSVMCSYNLLNGTYACENDKILNDIVKREYGFQGYIMSDWSAQHSTISANAGLDMTMPGDITFDSGDSYFGGNLTAFVANKTISESRVTDMATRILAAWYLAGQDDESYPSTNFDAFKPANEATNSRIDVQDDHYKFVRTLGSASTVLLKNKNNALPLGQRGKFGKGLAERTIALIGSGAGPGRAGPNEFSDQGGAISGALAMGWGSGTAWFTDLISPLAAIQPVARKFSTTLSWLLDDFDLDRAASTAARQSAALVFLKADSGEDYITVDGNEGDRKNLTAWFNGDNLVNAVAAQNNNTIVIVNSVGPLILEPWIDHPNVTAVLWAGLPGEESGNSLVDVLYGNWNPSGRLPYTIAKKPEDYSAQVTRGGGPNDVIRIPYTEGLLIDYRHFDANKIEPRFEFGFGLSYTTFNYTNVRVEKVGGGYGASGIDQSLISAWESGTASNVSTVGSSRAFWLHQPIYKVSFTVQNTGKTFGGDAPQLYINFPSSSREPPSVFRGLDNVVLSPGDRTTASITLSRYDLSVWDTEKQGWKRPQGDIGVSIGASSRDIRQKAVIPK